MKVDMPMPDDPNAYTPMDHDLPSHECLPPPATANDEPVESPKPIREFNRRTIFISGVLLELLIAGIASVILLLFPQSYAQLNWSLQPSIWLIGISGTLPLLLLFWLVQKYHWTAFRSLEQVKEDILLPMLRASTYFDILLYSILAGVCEELLFRGVIQTALSSPLSPIGAILLSNLLFGLVHPLGWVYILAVAFIGCYLGLLLWWTQSIVVVMLVHGLYDFIVMLSLKREADGFAVPAPLTSASDAKEQIEELK